MITSFIQVLNQIPPEGMLGLEVLCCAFIILLLLKFQGLLGLYTFSIVGIIASNILVLKTTHFSFYHWPVALGTGIFCMILCCNDIMNEYYGRRAALKGVLAGFLGYLCFTVLMVIGLGFKPAAGGNGIHHSLEALFFPSPVILGSSLTAFLISQGADVFIFRVIRWLTKGKLLWLRTMGSTLISSFIDNLIFSFLAWHYLADHPKPFMEIWHTYVLGFYGLRVILSLVATPLIYLAKWCIPKGNDKTLS